MENRLFAYKEETVKALVGFCRLLIGLVFVFSGSVKAVDPMGGAIKIGDYLMAFGLDFFRPVAVLGAFLLVIFEFMLGVCLLVGVYRRMVSLLALVFMCVMTPLTLYLALFNPVTDCGCFGDAIHISNWATFGKNVVLTGALVFLLRHNRKVFACFSNRCRWFVPAFACFFCFVFAYINYNHLPFIDFRPYKVGVNIPEQMRIPEGAAEDEYLYSFVYEKEGVEKVFSLDDYPKDSSWTFVESKTSLLKKGYTPLITDFHIFDEDGQEVTDALLQEQGDVFLLVAPQLENANDKSIDQITNLYEYAFAHSILFYAITGSSADAVEPWIARTGADYPFLYADPVLLKTLIRANPGFVWMRGGTIQKKWHYNDIPEEEVAEALFASPSEDDYSGKGNRRIVVIVFTFTVPLLLVWAYDYGRFRRRKRSSGLDEQEID